MIYDLCLCMLLFILWHIWIFSVLAMLAGHIEAKPETAELVLEDPNAEGEEEEAAEDDAVEEEKPEAEDAN